MCVRFSFPEKREGSNWCKISSLKSVRTWKGHWYHAAFQTSNLFHSFILFTPPLPPALEFPRLQRAVRCISYGICKKFATGTSKFMTETSYATSCLSYSEQHKILLILYDMFIFFIEFERTCSMSLYYDLGRPKLQKESWGRILWLIFRLQGKRSEPHFKTWIYDQRFWNARREWEFGTAAWWEYHIPNVGIAKLY